MPARRLGDLAYALGGWFLLALAPAAGVIELLSLGAVGTGPAFVLAALVAVPLAAFHWLGRRSVGPLGAMFFWAVALSVTAALPLAFLLDRFAVGGGLGAPPVRLAFLAAVYSGAYVVGVQRRFNGFVFRP